MSIQLANNITKRIWDAIPMTDTIIARLNELEKGEPENCIFTDRKGRIIGDAKITGADTSGNKEPQQTQLPKYIEVTPLEAIPNIDLNINPNKK